MAYLRSLGPQVHLMQLLAVRAYEPLGTIRLSLYQFRFANRNKLKTSLFGEKENLREK